MLHLLKLKFKMKKYLLLLISLIVTSTAMSQQISLTNFNTEVFVENFSSKSPLFSFETTSENTSMKHRICQNRLQYLQFARYVDMNAAQMVQVIKTLSGGQSSFQLPKYLHSAEPTCQP